MLFGAPESRKTVSFQSRLVMAAERHGLKVLCLHCDTRLSEVMCSLCLEYLLG